MATTTTDSTIITASNDNTNMWSICVKQVHKETDSFTVQVSPDDEVARLQETIQSVTGLAPSRQRLVYRGRLLATATEKSSSSNNDDKINNNDDSESEAVGKPEATTPRPLRLKDIAGLADGHTIHLLPKMEEPTTTDDATQTDEAADTTSSSPATTGDFLAALLGMDATSSTTTQPRSRPISRVRSPRQRRYHHRLDADDLVQEDPGSMESVRQGLMTLHTLLPSASATTESPLHVNRRWYLGQWLDCLDTVHQWLEATVIDIVDPDAILPPPRSENTEENGDLPARTQFITSEPRTQESFVAAADLERRTQMLLERCDEGDPHDEGGVHAGWKRRDNRGVQLLLIHYNGWPHRWDEWIRSDSDRLRPFRTRTRHPNSSPFACPTPQSAYGEAPSTHFRSDVEMEDRQALLPELGRVMNQINSLLNRINARSSEQYSEQVSAEIGTTNLPWRAVRDRAIGEDNAEEEKEEESAISSSGQDAAPIDSNNARQETSPRELEVLAPLLDRLGRSLIDAAPHVMSLARAARERDDDELPELEPVEEDEHPTSLGGLLSLLSRDRRHRSASAENVTATASDNTSAAHGGSTATANASDDVSLDPDHTDFSSGLVNTSRGEVRSGPRSRAQPSNDEAASLLGAYLASASLGGIGTTTGGDGDGGLQSLGRLLGDGAGGIDIHIHAVVTAPGMPAGVLGLAGLANGSTGGTTTAAVAGTSAAVTPEATGPTFLSRGRNSGRGGRSTNIDARSTASPVFQHDDEEDMGIFSELYTENPAPIDHISPSSSVEDQPAADAIVADDDDDDDEESESPSPLRPRRIQSRRNWLSSSRSPTNSSQSTSGSERGSQGRLFNRFFRRSNSET